MNTAISWQSRPVFVTSTFRDFQAERDHLHRFVFTELEERLKARYHYLEPIDLRWGVDTAAAGEEETRQRLVLKVCLAEIERSRPFLIALIGDRYGWVPPLERIRAAAEEAGHRGALEGTSVTALEIEYGVLDNPAQCARSRFYLREPLPYAEMAAASAALYSEGYSTEPGAATAAMRLAALKARIRTEQRGRWRTYRAEWDGARRCVTGLDAWGRQVLEDLWSDLAAETAAWAVAAPITWQAQEARLLEQLIALKCRDFVGREGLLGTLVRHATDPAVGCGDGLEPTPEGAWGICVTGPAGAGKTALFSRLHRLLSAQEVVLLAHAAGASQRAGRLEDLMRRWIGELAAALGLPDPAPDLTEREALQDTFARLLGQTAAGRRVVCLLDALDQLEATPAAQQLTWLPRLWPSNARLIATAIPCVASAALLAHPGVGEQALPRLDDGEAGALADRLCRRYHKTLPEPVRAALLAKTRVDGSSAAGLPLWLALAVEELLLLDADDFARARTLPGATAGERMRALLCAEAASFPPEIDALYGRLLKRAEQVHGRAWTRAFVELTALGRAGWRESDLKVLLPQVSGQAWDDLAFAALRRTLRAHLVQRGEQAQWDFAHGQLRAAVLARNLDDPARRRALHTRLADHLEGVSAEDPLRHTERMYHLIHADDRARVAAYSAGLTRPSPELTGAMRTLGEHLLAGEGATANGHLHWALGLLDLPGQAPARSGALCNRYLFDLRDALQQEARVELRLGLFEGVRDVLRRLAAAAPEQVAWRRDLAVSHNLVGDLRRARGDLHEAERAYRAELQISELLVAADPGNAEFRRDLALNHERLGDVRRARGDLDGAERAYRASLAIRERLVAVDPSDAQWQRDRAVGHERVGDVRQARGDLDGAERAYWAELAIGEHLAAADPRNAQWQRDRAVGHDRLGDLQQARGDLDGAERAYRASLAILERLVAIDPGQAHRQRDLAVSHNKVGDILRARGDLDGAEQAYRASLAIADRLVAADPGNAEWQRDLAVSHDRVGDVRQARGDPNGAERAHRASLAIRERLAAADPRNTEWQRDHAVSHNRLGDVRQAIGDLPGALASFHAALAQVQALAGVDPSNYQWRIDLWEGYWRIADVLERTREPAASMYWAKAQRVLADLGGVMPALPEADRRILERLGKTLGTE
ncbi:DUF4062 domain-containing protein [Thiocapsa marina]|uniref:Tetratricopeptide TPR_1 repeat-containing protein n=1 Tax=Thiocapsa marina 5811 TaxID=768671 RepID=F9UHP0_9GAMM|nr:DUF4062 domain-containing protein [Thiocapsa marina]EGV16216.1 Tetratricopeptide TPR_1 repeat-containing protein [Thiocapsa marina 5811]